MNEDRKNHIWLSVVSGVIFLGSAFVMSPSEDMPWAMAMGFLVGAVISAFCFGLMPGKEE